MASIKLGDMEHIAKKYCNGNMSEYLRQLILNDHNQRTNKQTIKKQTILGTTIMCIISGISFIMLTLSLLFPILLAATILFILIGGIILIIYGITIIYILKYKNPKGDIIGT